MTHAVMAFEGLSKDEADDVSLGDDADVTVDAGDRGRARLRGASLGERLGGFVYGTIVALSVIVTGTKAFPSELGQVAVLVVVTTLVFWLAHVYAHGIAFSVGRNMHLSFAELGRIAREEASIMASGVPPSMALVLGAVGVLSNHVAIRLAFGLGLAVLGATGLVYARVERLGYLRTLVAVCANLALGVALIGLKVFVVH
jgi:hypothetical protein